MKQQRKQEGAALFVVMMIVMVGTASAVFAAHTVSHEVRGTGFARQQLQTRYAARGALLGALEWFDIFGPETVRNIMLSKGSTEGKAFACTAGGTCYPEPPLPAGRRAYRLYRQHFDALVAAGEFERGPIDAPSAFGPMSAHQPAIVIDLYDEHVISKLLPGAAAQGGTKFKYMRTTMTARGRAQTGGDASLADDMGRQWNETGADMRAYVISGPFISGS
ncbi:MAG: hypothetical protein ACN4G0_11660 [Polyangiales bacterium]